MSIVIIESIARTKGVIEACVNGIKAADTKVESIVIIIIDKSIRDYNSKRSAIFAIN